MKIITSDAGKCVVLSGAQLWNSLYNMAATKLSEDDRDFLFFAMDFLETGNCPADDAQITARQLELMRRRFAKLAPACAPYDPMSRFVEGKHGCEVNPKASSCADFFTTADGEDLIEALIGLLQYADNQRVDTRAIPGEL